MPKRTGKEIESLAQNMSRWGSQFNEHARVLSQDVDGLIAAHGRLSDRVDPKWSVVKTDTAERQAEMQAWEMAARQLSPKNLDDHMYGAALNCSMMLSTLANEFDEGDDGSIKCFNRFRELHEGTVTTRQRYQNLGSSRAQKSKRSNGPSRKSTPSSSSSRTEALQRPLNLRLGRRVKLHEREALCDDPVSLANSEFVLQAELDEGIFYKVTGYSTRVKCFKVIYESCSTESHVTTEEMGTMLDNSYHIL